MRYGQFGPGGGSLPSDIMRTGIIAPFNPLHARHDVSAANVEREVRIPVAMQPGVAPGFGPPVGTPIPESPVTMLGGILLGADDAGRPVREFPVPEPASQKSALVAVSAMKAAAELLRKRGIESATPALIGGPLAALARGEAIVLRWTNGVAITAAL